MAFPTLITIRPYKDAYICFDTYKFIDMVGKKTPIFKFVHKGGEPTPRHCSP